MENNENTNALAVVDWETKLDTIRKTVAKDANDAEFDMFISLARTYNLNPLAHEIWFWKMDGQATIVTARDGYLKIANSSSHYQGMDSDVVYANDKFVKDKDGVKHMYTLQNRGNIVGAYAIVYRDDRKVPAYFFAPISNYGRQNRVWKQYTHAMILKVAEAMALKRAFSINGLVTQEELGENTMELEPEQSPKLEAKPSKSQLSDIWNIYCKIFNNDKEQAKQAMKQVTGKEKSSDYTDEDIGRLLADITIRETQPNEQVIDAEVSEPAPEENNSPTPEGYENIF